MHFPYLHFFSRCSCIPTNIPISSKETVEPELPGFSKCCTIHNRITLRMRIAFFRRIDISSPFLINKLKHQSKVKVKNITRVTFTISPAFGVTQVTLVTYPAFRASNKIPKLRRTMQKPLSLTNCSTQLIATYYHNAELNCLIY